MKYNVEITFDPSKSKIGDGLTEIIETISLSISQMEGFDVIQSSADENQNKIVLTIETTKELSCQTLTVLVAEHLGFSLDDGISIMAHVSQDKNLTASDSNGFCFSDYSTYTADSTDAQLLHLSVELPGDWLIGQENAHTLVDMLLNTVMDRIAVLTCHGICIENQIDRFECLFSYFNLGDAIAIAQTVFDFLTKNGLEAEKIKGTLVLDGWNQEQVNAFLSSLQKQKNKKMLSLFEDELGFSITQPDNTNSGKKDDSSLFSDSLDDLLSDSQPKRKASGRANKVMQRINELIGAEEFKAFATELYNLAQNCNVEILKKSLEKTCYVFSINDGCGLTTCCCLLLELLESLNLVSYSQSGCYAERPMVEELDREHCSYFEELRPTDDNGKFIVPDISSCMDKCQKLEFKKAMRELSHCLVGNTVVFRTPYVEEGTLKKIAYSINDNLNVKVLHFVPFSNADYVEFAKRKFEEMGFTLTKDAEDAFIRKLAEEKNDGKFYGFSTANKVVLQITYGKLCANLKSNNNSTVIEKADIDNLIATASSTLSGLMQLEKMVGSSLWLEQVKQIIATVKSIKAQKMSDVPIMSPSLHMQFIGAPGTGKTTVARIIGQIFKEEGILSIGHFYEVTRKDLVAEYVGQTAPKVAEVCRNAYGSVLFIDEAYSLTVTKSHTDFTKEAIETLISEMENHRSDLIVILAGYEEEMAEFLKSNPGIQSRIPYKLSFPNYDKTQLFDIFKSMLKGIVISQEAIASVKEYIDGITLKHIASKTFANGRLIRNLFERIWAKAALRHSLSNDGKFDLAKEDVLLAITDEDFQALLIDEKGSGKLGF